MRAGSLLSCALASFLSATPAPPSFAAEAGPPGRDKVMAALPRIEALAQKLIDENAVPGLSIAVVYEDQVVYLKGFGLREAGKPERVDADTVFQLASLSKPISSTVVAALVSDGVVSWDSRIADLDPGFRLADPYPTAELTLRDLFAHRSGLPGDAGNELEALGFGRDEILRRLRFVKPSSSFRAGYSYSNFGLTEGGVAAARAAGKSWEDVAEAKLYRPLGMVSTSSRYADFVARPNRAALHILEDGKWQARIKRQPDAQAPAGGVSSNARDLAQWMRLELANGRLGKAELIKPAALAQSHLPIMQRGRNPISGAPSFYGLGWGVEYEPHGVEWTHAGAFSVGARTLVKLAPEAHLGIVVLANAFPTGAPDGIADIFFGLVFDGQAHLDRLDKWNALYGSLFEASVKGAAVYAKPPDPAAPALPLEAYVGRYANDFIGEAAIAAEGGALRLKLGPKQEKSFPLRHFDRDRFLYVPAEEPPALAAAVTFEIGPDGKAAQVTIEDLDAFGAGVLRRIGD